MGEKTDPKIYAENTRNKLASKIKMPKIDFCWEDAQFQDAIQKKYKYNPNFCIPKFHKMRVLYQAKYKSLMKYADEFLNPESSEFVSVFRVAEAIKNPSKQPIIAKQDFLNKLDLENYYGKSDRVARNLPVARVINKFYEKIGTFDTWPEILHFSDCLEILVVRDIVAGIQDINVRQVTPVENSNQ